MMLKVTIIGLDTVGGSLGMALAVAMAESEEGPGQIQIVGYDEDRRTQREARLRGAIDREANSLEDAVQEAGLVIIAAPSQAVGETLHGIAPFLQAGSIVTDTASSKAQVLKWAKEFLPPEVSFVGGHPIFPPELEVDWEAGIKGAKPDLFKEALYCLTPAPNASDKAVQTVSGLVHMIGANAYFMDALEHDGLLGGVSHMPQLAISAVMYTIASSASWRELKLLTDPSFRYMNWLLTPPSDEFLQASLTNRPALLSWLDRVIAVLQQVRQELDDPKSEGRFIHTMLEEARSARRDWINKRDERAGEAGSDSMSEVESPGQQMLHMFVPRAFRRKRPEE